MNAAIRLSFILSALVLFGFGQSRAQTADPLRGSLPERLSVPSFNSLFGPSPSGAPGSTALPPQYSNENWSGGFGMPGLDGDVRAMAWKDGDLYVGGSFLTAAGIYANHIARWDGTRWEALGSEFNNGVDGEVRAIAVEGDKVYVAGEFTRAGGLRARNIAVWDVPTRTWSTLEGGVGGVFGSVVNSMVVHNGQVYVGGRFIAAGKTVAVNIARWDGTSWKRVGTGINDAVTALYRDGQTLYAAGKFTLAGNIRSPGLARFNLSAQSWESIGITISGTVETMTADAQYLYIGGEFTTVNGRTMNNIARMNKGTGEWSAMDRGFKGEVKTILLRGSEVIVGGKMIELVGRTLPRGYDVRRLAKWDGTQWSVFARRSAASGRDHGSSGVIKASRAESIDDPDVLVRDNGEGIIYALAQTENGDLYIGGSFDVAGPAYVVPLLTPAAAQIIPDPEMAIAANICKLMQNDTVWTSVGGGLDNHVYAMADDGDYLYLGGRFLNAAEQHVNRITRLNKQTRQWEALGAGTNDDVLALAVDGTNLYAGGVFRSAGGTNAFGLARWDAAARSWSRVGNYDFDSVSALAVVDGNLYAGGSHGLARWNGSSWTTLYDGSSGPVAALVRDGGKLYVGGTFGSIGSVQAKNIAALNLADDGWTALGAGTDGPVYSLAVWNGLICAGGDFTQAGSAAALNLASWNPANGEWKPLGAGINGEIRALAPGRFGLYAGGNFRALKTGQMAGSMGLWNGTTWQALGSGVLELISNATVHALVANDDYLYVGGTQHFAGGKTSFYLARWTYPPLNSIGQENPPSERQELLPSSLMLSGTIYPNPALDKGTVRISLSDPVELTADIFNSAGERVAAVAEGSFDAGTHELPLKTADLPDGLYFVRIATAQGTETTPFIVRR